MCQLPLTLFLTPFHIRTIDTLLVRTDLHPKVHVALAKTPWKLILFFCCCHCLVFLIIKHLEGRIVLFRLNN